MEVRLYKKSSAGSGPACLRSAPFLREAHQTPYGSPEAGEKADLLLAVAFPQRIFQGIQFLNKRQHMVTVATPFLHECIQPAFKNFQTSDQPPLHLVALNTTGELGN